MERNRPRGREKYVSGQSGTVSKKDEPTNVGGPVGNTNGYQGRPSNGKIPFSGNRPNGTQNQGQSGGNRAVRRAGGGVGTIVLLLVVYLLFSGKCSGSNVSSVLTNVAGEVAGYTQQQTQQTYNYATEAPTATPRLTATPTKKPTVSGSFTGVNSATAASTTVASTAREKYTTIRGNGEDTVTIMVYMCGTDLESNYGMATNDLNEMLGANLSDKVNLIIETGGCKKWQNSVMSNSTNQRYQITSKGLVRLEDSVGKSCMTDGSTLVSFIKYCKSNYPADRYALIMWDHGGGSVSGYGYDQLFSSNGSMQLDTFTSSLKKAGCKFDFIGFDACLMATFETCVACEPYADYLIASEETEPGVGWYYTDWLTLLSKNTSVSTVKLGKQIIDDFVTVCYKNSPSDKTTLSIVDLAEFSGTVPTALREFAVATTGASSSDIQKISTARSKSREFSSESKLDQVDLIHLAKNIGTTESIALANALSDCVKYNRTSSSMTNANGISIYFPYRKTSTVSSAVSVYDGIGMDEAYTKCIKSFASMVAGGQIGSTVTGTSGYGSLTGSLFGSSGIDLGSILGSSSSDYGIDLGSLLGGSSSSSSSYGSYDPASIIGALLGGSSSSSSSGSYDAASMIGSLLGIRSTGDTTWIDTELIADNASQIAATSLMPDDIKIQTVNGHKVVSMSEEKWDLVQSVALNVFFDDGQGGYIDLGIDNVLEYDENDNLLCEYDGTWLALDGHICPYYLIDESYEENGDGYCIRGYVPALLTGTRQSVDSDETIKLDRQRVEIMLVFDNDHQYGTVAGVRPMYDGDEVGTVAKGGLSLENGDELTFLCDYYDKNGTFSANYELNDPLVVNGAIEIANVSVEGGGLIASYRFTDIYNNEYWTETF